MLEHHAAQGTRAVHDRAQTLQRALVTFPGVSLSYIYSTFACIDQHAPIVATRCKMVGKTMSCILWRCAARRAAASDAACSRSQRTTRAHTRHLYPCHHLPARRSQEAIKLPPPRQQSCAPRCPLQQRCSAVQVRRALPCEALAGTRHSSQRAALQAHQDTPARAAQSTSTAGVQIIAECQLPCIAPCPLRLSQTRRFGLLLQLVRIGRRKHSSKQVRIAARSQDRNAGAAMHSTW